MDEYGQRHAPGSEVRTPPGGMASPGGIRLLFDRMRDKGKKRFRLHGGNGIPAEVDEQWLRFWIQSWTCVTW